MEDYSLPSEQNSIKKDLPKSIFSSNKLLFYFLGLFLALGFFYFVFFSSPINFPQGIIVNIEQGSSLRSVSRDLQEAHVISSRIAFEAFAIIYDGEKHLIPGDYLFENKVPVFEVARRIAKGEHHLAPVKVTIPEGYDVFQIAHAFGLKLSNFNQENFIKQAKDKEGYLFPDTYFFLTTDDENSVLKYMRDNFTKKVSSISSVIASSDRDLRDIIIMASIVEREAKGDTDRGFISGILWRRISVGMPLQVDAAPITYKNKGLPKAPICNPGLEAIKASLYPENSPFLYYLHDSEGVIHFALDFEEHKINKIKYLK